MRQPFGVVNRSEVVAASFDDRFDELFRVAYRAAFGIVGVRADAEDCAQESLVRAFGRWSTVEP
jgi:DNA-directed RNA polymerase specialized sigma24 family protein